MNYGILKNDVRDYLHRTDLATQIPFFIEKARVRIGRDLRSLEQELTGTLTSPVDDVFALPVLCQEVRRVENEDGTPLRSVSPHELSYWASYGSPAVYCVRGREITIPSATSVTIWYITQEATLVLDATEHPTMAAHPQVWLLASLMEAGYFLQDWELVDRTRDQYVAEVTEINKRADRLRHPHSPEAISSDRNTAFGGSGL
jgi:hypothetical protein